MQPIFELSLNLIRMKVKKKKVIFSSYKPSSVNFSLFALTSSGVKSYHFQKMRTDTRTRIAGMRAAWALIPNMANSGVGL